MITLRKYQEDAIHKIKKTTDNFLVILPTGSGKTEIFIKLIKDYIKENKKILLIVNRLVLLEQTIRRLEEANVKLNLHHISAQNKINEGINLYISTSNTLNNDKKLANLNFDIIIIDEVHHIMSSTIERLSKKRQGVKYLKELNLAEDNRKEFEILLGKNVNSLPILFKSAVKPTMLNKIVSKYPNARIIGFTATHQRDNLTVNLEASITSNFFELNCNLKQNQCICTNKVFDHNPNNLYYKGLKSMIDEGYLCKPVFKVWETGFFQGGQVSDVSYQKLFLPYNNKVLDEIIDDFTKDLNKKIVVFLPNIAALNVVSENLTLRKIKHKNVHMEIPKEEQEKTLEKFKTNECNLILNCSILTEGYDNPLINKIIILRACRSNVLFLQMIGRGLRLNKEEPNKICEVFDYSMFYKNYQSLERYEIYKDLLENKDWNKCNHTNNLIVSQVSNTSQNKLSKPEKISKYHFNLLEIGTFTLEDIFNKDFKTIMKYYKIYNIKPSLYLEDKAKSVTIIHPYLTPINERYSFACLHNQEELIINRDFYLYDHQESKMITLNKTIKLSNLKKDYLKLNLNKVVRNKEPIPYFVERLKKEINSCYLFENDYDIKNLYNFIYLFNKTYKWLEV